MSITTSNNQLTWNLYLKSGNVEIWQGTPRFGAWEQWECKNVQSGETRNVNEGEIPFVFQQMISNQED